MDIWEVTPGDLREYGQVPIRFWVRERWTPTGFVPVAHPWLKEYDVPGNRPQDWHLHFDLARWGRWKLHLSLLSQVGGKYTADEPPLLYDLEVDPSESRNVAAQHPDVVAEMQAMVAARSR
ncbi:MAG: hypothetical protein ACK4NQ_05820 [Fimbriimonadaceae bacterium]